MDKKDYKVKLPDWFKQDETSDSGVLEGYVPPIKISMDRVMMDVENGIVKAVQKVGFDVDKEELTKALQYDRGQYDKGFADGVKHAVKKMAEMLKSECTIDEYDSEDVNHPYVIAEYEQLDEIAKEITENEIQP